MLQGRTLMIQLSRDSLTYIPESVFEEKSALKFLELSIIACLVSHLEEIDKDLVPEMTVSISGGEIKIITTKKCCGSITAACRECFVLNNLKFKWVVKIGD
jgi:hypothetical protein